MFARARSLSLSLPAATLGPMALPAPEQALGSSQPAHCGGQATRWKRRPGSAWHLAFEKPGFRGGARARALWGR